MNNKDKTVILSMITIICFILGLMINKINNLKTQVTQQEQTINRLEDGIVDLTDLVTELNIKIK